MLFVERGTRLLERETHFLERGTRFLERDTHFLERGTLFLEREATHTPTTRTAHSLSMHPHNAIQKSDPPNLSGDRFCLCFYRFSGIPFFEQQREIAKC